MFFSVRIQKLLCSCAVENASSKVEWPLFLDTERLNMIKLTDHIMYSTIIVRAISSPEIRLFLFFYRESKTSRQGFIVHVDYYYIIIMIIIKYYYYYLENSPKKIRALIG